VKADAIIEIRFKTTAEGGRATAVGLSEIPFYACPLLIDGQAFDCRIFLDGKILELGKIYKLPVKFMNFKIVSPLLSIEKQITLWEGKEIANGKVLEILNNSICGGEPCK
jgi:hypothetical protein